jgi:hypothetical protein
VLGGTLEQTLDRVCDFYGYRWSKQGDWYLFRNRQWIEQERVAVPEPVLRALGLSLGTTEHLTQSDATALAALTDEQLLTLQLFGSAAGRTYASPDEFDYNDVQLIHVGLTLYSQMTEGQRAAAREAGLPYLLMSPVQQYLFASTAHDRGYELTAEEAQGVRFRLTDEFHRERLPAGWAELGSAKMEFAYGHGSPRAVTLAIRAPVAPAPEGTK